MPYPQCQHENQKDAKFCDECGAPLPVCCPSCQTANRPGAKFCHACATPLAVHTLPPSAAPRVALRALTDVQPAPPPALPLRAATAQGATPPALADTTYDFQSALDGERKQVTVLFADISGFTALAETMDPEDVRHVMNTCFALLVPVVDAYGGTIDKFIGDEIMALFGAPIA